MIFSAKAPSNFPKSAIIENRQVFRSGPGLTYLVWDVDDAAITERFSNDLDHDLVDRILALMDAGTISGAKVFWVNPYKGTAHLESIADWHYGPSDDDGAEAVAALYRIDGSGVPAGPVQIYGRA